MTPQEAAQYRVAAVELLYAALCVERRSDEGILIHCNAEVLYVHTCCTMVMDKYGERYAFKGQRCLCL